MRKGTDLPCCYLNAALLLFALGHLMVTDTDVAAGEKPEVNSEHFCNHAEIFLLLTFKLISLPNVASICI